MGKAGRIAQVLVVLPFAGRGRYVFQAFGLFVEGGVESDW